MHASSSDDVLAMFSLGEYRKNHIAHNCGNQLLQITTACSLLLWVRVQIMLMGSSHKGSDDDDFGVVFNLQFCRLVRWVNFLLRQFNNSSMIVISVLFCRVVPNIFTATILSARKFWGHVFPSTIISTLPKLMIELVEGRAWCRWRVWMPLVYASLKAQVMASRFRCENKHIFVRFLCYSQPQALH